MRGSMRDYGVVAFAVAIACGVVLYAKWFPFPSYAVTYETLDEHFPVPPGTHYWAVNYPWFLPPTAWLSETGDGYVGVAVPGTTLAEDCLFGGASVWVFKEDKADDDASFVYKGRGVLKMPPCIVN